MKKENNLIINYDLLTIEAMQNLVKKVLNDVSINGLPQKHHFYITYLTNYKDVVIPKSLKEKYPKEMTIVIENSFWDLVVYQENFTLKLSFDGLKSKLIIPFKSIVAFSDPYANFHLKFPKINYNENKIKDNKTDIIENIINIEDFKKDK